MGDYVPLDKRVVIIVSVAVILEHRNCVVQNIRLSNAIDFRIIRFLVKEICGVLP